MARTFRWNVSSIGLAPLGQGDDPNRKEKGDADGSPLRLAGGLARSAKAHQESEHQGHDDQQPQLAIALIGQVQSATIQGKGLCRNQLRQARSPVVSWGWRYASSTTPERFAPAIYKLIDRAPFLSRCDVAWAPHGDRCQTKRSSLARGRIAVHTVSRRRSHAPYHHWICVGLNSGPAYTDSRSPKRSCALNSPNDRPAACSIHFRERWCVS